MRAIDASDMSAILKAPFGQDAIMLSPVLSYVSIILGFTESSCKV